MMKIKEKIIDSITGEESLIEREETLGEKKDREQLQLKLEKESEMMNMKAEARRAILSRLGVTEEEMTVLLG